MIDFIKDIISWVFSLIRRAAEFLLEVFLALGLFSKLLCFTIILAFFAITRPTARYYIFESWFHINNPVAENLIGIVLLVIIGFFIPSLFALILRVVPSSLYFFYVLYLQVTRSISKAPYELTFWHYLNLTVPLLIIAFSLAIYFNHEDS
ncbi:MAG: hypothetical protein FWG92_03660 [Leptospirales bacterium]|nr:hypothetical protein [Leptospirales bacterium]